MEQQNYTVTVPLKDLLQIEYTVESRLNCLSILEDTINPDSMVLAGLYFAEKVTYSNLKDLDITNIEFVNVDLYELQDFSVESKLTERPWQIILATNWLLAGAEENNYLKDMFKEKSWEETYSKIKEQYDKKELNWQEYGVTVLGEWLKKNWSENIDKWNDSVKSGTKSVLKFIDAVQSYTGASQKPGLSIGGFAKGLINQAMLGFTNAVSDLSDAFSMSNSELAAKLRGTGAGLLRGSILSEDYLKLVTKRPGLEPISLSGMTFLKGQKSGDDNYGPTVLPFKMASGGTYLKLVLEKKVDHGERIAFDSIFVRKTSELEYEARTYDKSGTVSTSTPWKDVKKVKDKVTLSEANTESAILTQDMLNKGEAISDPVLSSKASLNLAANPSKISEEHHKQIEAVKIEANAQEYYAAKEILTKPLTQELSKNSKYIPSSTQYPDPSEHHYEENPLDLLHTIITSLDAQMQRFVAYFTTIDENNEEHFLRMETPDKASEYFYFFYSNGFTCSPVKKSMTELKYGAFKTSVALERPDVNNTFSFSLPTDLQASFWKFVMQNGLGVNLESNVYSNENFFTENIHGINLNFVLVQSNKDSGVITKETARVNKFVLENIYFSNIDALKFQQDFGSSPIKSSIKGIYKRLTWYHNSILEPAKN